VSEVFVKIVGQETDLHDLDLSDGVFDHPIQPDLLREFCLDSRHHLAVAVVGTRLVGFASAVHYVHPDKPAELWVNEVGVVPQWRGRGCGTRLMQCLFDHASALSCREAWLVTVPVNHAACRLYERLGGRLGDARLYSFDLK